MVKPSDIYVLAGLLTLNEGRWTYRKLAEQLQVPLPLVQRSLSRAAAADLYEPESKRVHVPNFERFLPALRHVAPAPLGEVVPGVPAAWAAAPMSQIVVEVGDDLPPVWPSALGRTRGRALRPLHESAAEASQRNPRLGELLSVIDSFRAGDVRVRSVAEDVAHDLLRVYA